MQFRDALQVQRVELRFPVWQGLAPVSSLAANERLVVCLAQDEPVQGSYFRVALALQPSLPQRDEEHMALPLGPLWQARRCVAAPRHL